MRASELIQRLEELKKEHGDLEIYIDQIDGFFVDCENARHSQVNNRFIIDICC